MNDRWFFIMLLTLFGSMAVSAFLSGDPVLAIPIVLVALIAIAFWALQRMLGKAALARHGGDVHAVNSDESDPFPSTNAIEEEHTALGASEEQHADLSPHDLPPGSPVRREVERQAVLRGGTTRGNVDPSEDDGGGVIATEDPSARGQGYAPGETPSAPYGKQAGPPRGRG
jgi:hypothetical protein